MKFILLRKHYIALLDEGGGILAMDYVPSGSIIIPYVDIINPSSFP